MKKDIINFLVSLKNISVLKKEFLVYKYSKIILNIVEVLYKEGFLQSFNIVHQNFFYYIYIYIRYFFNKSILKDLKLLETSSRFSFLSYHSLLKINTNSKNTLFISTTNGIMTLQQCKKNKIGGKPMFYC
jgi:small subunit ribosomal protein S8